MARTLKPTVCAPCQNDTSTLSDRISLVCTSTSTCKPPTVSTGQPAAQSSNTMPSFATCAGTSTAGAGESKKRKRASLFRIKVGCVVALRYRPHDGNNLTMIIPPYVNTNSKNTGDDTDIDGVADSSEEPSKQALRGLLGNTDHNVEVWTDPIPGRDQGLALIGRRVRCCFASEIKAKSFIAEGEIVAVLSFESPEQNQDKKEPSRKKEEASFAVELLLDREYLSKLPFLERTDEDIDLNQIKKESQKRSHKNELAIKGANKVTVKVKLALPTGIASSTSNNASQSNVAKWAIRKRIPNKPGQPAQEQQILMNIQAATNAETPGNAKNEATDVNGTKSTSMATVRINYSKQLTIENPSTTKNLTERTENPISASVGIIMKNRNTKSNYNGSGKKSKSATSGPTQYLGDGNDGPPQQQQSWRWFVARNFGMYLQGLNLHPPMRTAAISSTTKTVFNHRQLNRMLVAQYFHGYYSNLLASCGGFIGEVLQVTPSAKPGSSTLGIVTMRRLVVPEHTASGRLSRHSTFDCGHDIEVLDDYDATLNEAQLKSRCYSTKWSPSEIVFSAPIEELVIISHQLKRTHSDDENDSSQVSKVLNGNKSLDEELFVHWSYSLHSDTYLTPQKMVLPRKSLEETTPFPGPLSKKKLQILSTCHRCRKLIAKADAIHCHSSTDQNSPTCRSVQYYACRSMDKEIVFTTDNPKEGIAWCKSCLLTLQAADFIINARTNECDPMLLPCCAVLCDCPKCQLSSTLEQNRHILTMSVLGRLPMDDDNNKETIDDKSPFFEAVACIQAMLAVDFDLPRSLIRPDQMPLASSKPITKVKLSATKSDGARARPTMPKQKTEKRARSKPPSKKNKKRRRASSPRPRSPPANVTSPIRAFSRHVSEDYSVFQASCSRLLKHGAATAAKANCAADDEEQRLTLGSPFNGDKPRNLREIMPTYLITVSTDKDEKTSSSRAMRASQRRLIKDVARLGASSLNLDTLAGRESQLRFDRSAIHAWGVFADGEISAGDLIVEYRGELIGNAMAEKREREYESAKIGSDYMFRIDGLTVCDATRQGNVARFINASCDANCYTKIITIDGKQRIVIYAKKDIKIGEELCYDYKFPLEYDESKRIPCYCGARECRGYMNWVSSSCCISFLYMWQSCMQNLTSF